MKKETVEIYNEKNNITAQFKKILFDKPLASRYTRFTEYCEKNQIIYNKDHYKKARALIEDIICNAFKEYQLLTYLNYNLSNNWGEMGEQQIKISFCRNLLNVGHSEELTQEHATEFMNLIEKKSKDYKVDNLNADQMLKHLNSFTWNIFEEKYRVSNLNQINSLLIFLGSSLSVVGGSYGSEKIFFMGKGNRKKVGSQFVLWLNSEIARTPNAIMALAAFNSAYTREICIRNESLKTIFYQKWIDMFDHSSEFTDDMYIERNISEGIKDHTLSLYNVQDKESLLKKEKQFIEDMGETIMYHEVGHIVSQSDILPITVSPIIEASKIQGENILSTLLEIIADFSPNINDQKGPMQNLVDIAKENRNRADRMFYMYLSDVWFFDTEDEYMYLYSDLMALILLRYIKKDKQIDYKSLEHDLYFDPKKEPHQKDAKRFVNFLFKLLVSGSTMLENIISNIEFEINGKKQEYKYIKELLYYNFKKKNVMIDESSYSFMTKYWSLMIHNVRLFSKDIKSIDIYLEQERKDILRKMFIATAGKKVAESYIYDHRQFIYDSFIQIGIKRT
ncbi:hypothetical protein DID75_01125 [Candidatus Marinamargulisbacteria bacterium SCGC AG-410-N11]|nr:hypothetical protein DID75_01125 [Candidatus Marinamargulisbacteria bacterium SCGC AG-410-N11]